MGWFSRNSQLPLKVDIHSHLIPGIDDGSSSISESLELVKELKNLGFEKIITTPHIHPRYPNNSEDIAEGLAQLQKSLLDHKIDIEIEAAAEYYIDESFIERLNRHESLLTFGDRMLLVECSFINKPLFFNQAIFEIQKSGYQPILAHPERYKFLEGSMDWLMELKAMGVLFQVTLGSLSGYYGEMPRKMGKQLLKKGMIDFLATDIHRMAMFPLMKKGLEMKEVQQLIKSGSVKNHTLL